MISSPPVDPLKFLYHSAAGPQKFRCHAAPEMMLKHMIYKKLLPKTEAVSLFSLTAAEFGSAPKRGFGRGRSRL
jgi:hypothetical protein